MGEVENINNQNALSQFVTMQDFIAKFDTNKDGSLNKNEITAAQQYFKDAGITSVTIDDIDYNLITDEDMNKQGKLNGTGKNDLILSTQADKIKGKGGDDVIFSSGASEINGNNGADTVYYEGNNAKITGGMGKDNINVKGDNNNIKGNWGWDDFHVKGDNNTVKGNAGADDFYIDGDSNKIDVGDWANRSVLGKVLTFLPKVLYSCFLAIPSNIAKMVAPEGELSKKIDQRYKQLWGNFENKVFLNGEKNTIKTDFTGNINEHKNKGVDLLYRENEAAEQNVEGSFQNYYSYNDENRGWILKYFREWINRD